MDWEDRFWKKVVKTKTCWIWTASLDTNGYGQFAIMGKPRKGSHKIAYELLVKTVPKGKNIDHLCGNRKCVNPKHLEAVTQRVNVLRGNSKMARRAQQTHCHKGHEFTRENTIRNGTMRNCRECAKQHSLNYYNKKQICLQ